MNKTSTIILTLFISLGLVFAGISDAEAKRFGGARSRSFGGKRAYSSPYRRSTMPARSASQQKAYQHNQAARQAMSRRGGLMGMLGGLALGGLLGALFFGGAFEGINFMDILIFGGLAYLLYRLFAGRAPASQPVYGRSGHDDAGQDYRSYGLDQNRNGLQDDPAGFDTDVLFGRNKKQPQAGFSGSEDAEFSQRALPAGFDPESFLTGAKAAFRQLQQAWGSRDLAEIRGLTTDKVFEEIQRQVEASDDLNDTEVLKLDAELLDVREVGNELEALVLFDAILREGAEQQAAQVREVWHFVKPVHSVRFTWYLDGIQQLED